MSHQSRAAWLLVTALFVSPVARLHGQQPDARLPLTSTSESAKRAFRAALLESQNASPERAISQIGTAVRDDAAFGLAQIYQTVLAPGMTGVQRAERIGQQLNGLGTATSGEVLLALYWREVAAGRGTAALPILKTLVAMVPNDAEVNYILDGVGRAALSGAEQATKLRAFAARFPEHGPAYNQLGYALWNAGDAQGALAAMEQQMKVAPNHPNAHDSYADILILLGRNADAVPHVKRELEIDPAYDGALTKLGSIYLATGNLAGARAEFDKAVSTAPTPAARLEAMGWQVAYDVYAKDGRGAVQELSQMVAVAKEANMRGAGVVAHDRTAVIEAYTGDRKTVAMHLGVGDTATVNAANKTAHYVLASIALSRAGMGPEARAAAAQYASAAPNSALNRTLEGILALDGKDYKAAETAIGGMSGKDPLTKALRAELLMRTGRKDEGKALQAEVLAASVKEDSRAPMNFLSLVARLRVGAL